MKLDAGQATGAEWSKPVLVLQAADTLRARGFKPETAALDMATT
jgi:hypothetical protein